MISSAFIRWILFVMATLVLVLGYGLLAQPHPEPMPSKNVACSSCHQCKNPTKENPCLDVCPRPRATPKDLAKVPETVVLNELEDEYEGVVFNHRLHASMSAMGTECSTCHHYTPEGYLACKECHLTGAEENLEQPGLKGAYHRLCLACHQSWSGTTNCETCHAKKAVPGPPAGGAPVVEQPPRRYFRSIEEPQKKVWHSSYGGGTVVTLHHREHVEVYGIDCAACHHAESCESCHEQGKTIREVRHSEAALHAICNSCHAEMSCDQCHLKKEAVAFSHDRTGWPLGRFHDRLQCRACHGNPYHFTKPDPACNACHSSWNPTNFDHARTGLTLDENHREFDCVSCHAERKFDAGPTCTECHDTDFRYPAQVPGTMESRVSPGK